MTRLVPAVAAASCLLLTGCGDDGAGAPSKGTVTAAPSASSSTAAASPSRSGAPAVESTVASRLAVPWGIAFLPDGSALVTERDSTRLLRLDPGGDVDEVAVLEAAAPQGEGGVLGVAVSPAYDEDSWVFVYVTTPEDNRVVRYTFDGSALADATPILTGVPNGFIHDGGRMLFGPDGYLYVSTGETGEPALAQDRDSLGGKILRIDTDGRPAPDNPDPDSPVFTWGHRNVQGLAFDDDGNLWASEFGDSTWDELNLIRKGHNYGWPEVEGSGDDPRFTNPQVVWRTDQASPSGLAFLDGHLWLGALRGQRLWRVDVHEGKASDPEDFFVGDHGRLRTVVATPDDRLWVTTSNRDGRGTPTPQDDRILLVSPAP